MRDDCLPLSLDEQQRRFYDINEDAFARILHQVLTEELSVVEGGILEEFELASAAFFGTRHAVAVCNGTAALHLALFAMDLQPGDEVLLPVYAYYAMALPVCMMGAKPVFCDINAEDLTLDIADAEASITERTRAIIVHQPWGCPAHIPGLRDLADRHDLKLIADVSHAHGTLWDGKPLGTYYDYICASMGKGKLISGGELGVVTAPTDRCHDRMLLYGHVNRVPKGLLTDDYRHIDNAVGIKYRPHPFAMVLALEQMGSYSERSTKMVAHARAFEAGLADIPGFSVFTTPPEAERVYWRVPVRLDARLGDPREVAQRLAELGCPVQKKGGILLHTHTALTDYYGVETTRDFPVAEQVAPACLQVDIFALYDDAAVARALAAFRQVGETA
jgi:perosamine synthetase